MFQVGDPVRFISDVFCGQKIKAGQRGVIAKWHDEYGVTLDGDDVVIFKVVKGGKSVSVLECVEKVAP